MLRIKSVPDSTAQVLQEVLSPLRHKSAKQMTLIKAVQQQMASFDEYELERLRHAFVKLSGGDSRVAKLTLERIRYNSSSAIEQIASTSLIVT